MADATNQTVRFGISNVRYALETATGFGEWKRLAGAVQVSFEPQGSQNTFYADNGGYYSSNPPSSDQITIELADLTEQAKIDLLGYRKIDDKLCEPVVAKRTRFAMGFQVEGNGTTLRGVRYGGTLARPSQSHNTTTDSTDPDTITIEGTFLGRKFVVANEEELWLSLATTNEGDTHATYDSFWEAVPTPGTIPEE